MSAFHAAPARRLLFSCGLLALGLVRPASAQCPDGSQSPCASPVPIDTNRFVVLPFSVRGPKDQLYLGESMVDLLHMVLDGVGKVSVSHPQASLRRMRELSDPTDPIAAAPVARAMGAGRLIAGTVVVSGQELRFRADVHETREGKRLFSVEGRGTVARQSETIDRLAASILARKHVSVTQRVDLSELSSRSPSALQAYLVGMQFARRGDRKTACDSLKSAIRQDSTFGVAHYALVVNHGAANSICPVQGGLAALHRANRTLLDSFPPRVRAILTIRSTTMQGQRYRAIQLVDDLVRSYPNDADAAYERADVYFHFGLNTGIPRDQVLAVFRRALDLYNGDAELLDHYTVLMALSGDTVAWKSAQQACRAAAPSLCAEPLALRVLYRGERPWATEPADRVPAPYFFLLRAAPDLGFALAVTDSMYIVRSRPDRPPTDRYDAYMSRIAMAAGQGRYVLARALIDTVLTLPGSANPPMAMSLLVHLLSGVRDSGVVRALQRLPGGFQTPDTAPTGSVRQSFDAIRAWHGALTLPPDSAEMLIKRVAFYAWPDSARGVAIANGLRGLLALRRGDTATAQMQFRLAHSNHMRTTTNREMWPSVFLSLTAARVEAARGNWEGAKLFLADAYPTVESAYWLGDIEELRARVAVATGDVAAAERAYRQVISIWQNADPELQPRVAAAREGLARLVRP